MKRRGHAAAIEERDGRGTFRIQDSEFGRLRRSQRHPTGERGGKNSGAALSEKLVGRRPECGARMKKTRAWWPPPFPEESEVTSSTPDS